MRFVKNGRQLKKIISEMGRVTCYVKTRKQEKQLLLIKSKTEKTKLNDLTLFKVSNIIDD